MVPKGITWSPRGVDGLKLIAVARVPSKADFRLLFRGWKRFALNRNCHELG